MNFRENFIEVKGYNNWFKAQHIPKHKISYLDFGDVNNPNIIVCAHGLTRNAYDFVKIANYLSKYYRVISISYPGRGKSDYFEDKSLYNYQVYVKDTLSFLDTLNILHHNNKLIWLGTSMGGIIGMNLASKYNNLFHAMIINDIGAFIPADIVVKIIQYAKQKTDFEDLNLAKVHLKMIYQTFGITDEADWDYLTKNSFIKNAQGKFTMNYDVDVVKPISDNIDKIKDVHMWYLWQNITCPVLLIHGIKSNILSIQTINQMKNIRDFDLYTINDAGHAPALMQYDQINFINSWVAKQFDSIK